MKRLSNDHMRLYAISLTIILMFLISFNPDAFPEIRIRCASTTSTLNSGLFDYILPLFERKTGIKVDVVAVGTGAAIEIGKRGDVDVVFVHAKEQELKALQEGYFVNRHDVMYNDFIIVGPADDPLKIRGMRLAVEAFKRIAKNNYPFVSRGDRSGTHIKELSIWELVGALREPPLSKGGSREPGGSWGKRSFPRALWYLEVGQGMEKTLRIASEKRAYTLTDRGTWLATKDKSRLEMIIVLEGDPILFNQYGVMAVNPQRHKHVKYREAMEFINYLISEEGQMAIASFKDKYGNQLFIPNARKSR